MAKGTIEQSVGLGSCWASNEQVAGFLVDQIESFLSSGRGEPVLIGSFKIGPHHRGLLNSSMRREIPTSQGPAEVTDSQWIFAAQDTLRALGRSFFTACCHADELKRGGLSQVGKERILPIVEGLGGELSGLPGIAEVVVRRTPRRWRIELRKARPEQYP